MISLALAEMLGAAMKEDLTVGALRAALEGLADDMPVSVETVCGAQVEEAQSAKRQTVYAFAGSQYEIFVISSVD